MIQSGDILLVRTNGIIARCIQFFTGEYYNHCAVCINDKTIVEATPMGIISSSISKYSNVKIMRPKIMFEKATRVSYRAIETIGHEYDFFGILGWFLYYMTGGNFVKLFQARRHFYCSEHVKYVYSLEGIEIFPKDVNVTPGMYEKAPTLEEVKL